MAGVWFVASKFHQLLEGKVCKHTKFCLKPDMFVCLCVLVHVLSSITLVPLFNPAVPASESFDVFDTHT